MISPLKPERVLLYMSNGEQSAPAIAPYEHLFSFVEHRSIENILWELASGKFSYFLCRCESFNSHTREALAAIQSRRLPVKSIIIAKRATTHEIVEAMRLGANNFLIATSFTAGIVEAAIPEGYRRARGIEEIPRPLTGERVGRANFIGTSPAIYDIRSAVKLVANSPAAILITGESGTGKEIVARMIHQQSERGDKPFIAINCAALPRDVIENELFGHEKGAFTGAHTMKQGVFELANTGTLFFDEIAEMNPDMQAKLLRAIEQKAFRRLGGTEELTVDVRVLAATNKKIPAAIAAGQFREDLYYRFSVIEIEIPPLRSRCEDIPLLVDHFLAYFSGQYGKEVQKFSDDAISMLMGFEWPGNVRELRNVIERVVVTRNEPIIGVEVLPSRITGQRPHAESVTILLGTSALEADRILTVQTLTWCGHNRTRAAEVLGLNRKTLLAKLRKYGMGAPPQKPNVP